MRLAFIYFGENKDFRKHLIRYNSLLKNYFAQQSNSVVEKLGETFHKLLDNSEKYEILSKSETEVYNVIIDFLANNVDSEQVKDLQNQVYQEDLVAGIVQKITKELPDIDSKVIESVVERSKHFTEGTTSQNVEIVFIPSVINI